MSSAAAFTPRADSACTACAASCSPLPLCEPNRTMTDCSPLALAARGAAGALLAPARYPLSHNRWLESRRRRRARTSSASAASNGAKDNPSASRATAAPPSRICSAVLTIANDASGRLLHGAQIGAVLHPAIREQG